MIEVCGVSKSFGDTKILDDISLTVAKGERVSILGPGSCGKSVLLKLILGLEEVSTGSVSLLDQNIDQADEIEKRKILQRVGVAFQQGGLFDFMTVEENIMFALKHMTEFTEDKAREIIDGLLEQVKLPHTKSMYPYELSGGMKRRIGIARALATAPDIAIFDEPTSGLDPVTSTIILNMIGELGDERPESSLIVSTSSVEVAIRFASRIILMRDGRIVSDGKWQEMIVGEDKWITNFLGTRLIGIDISYARELKLPEKFIAKHWQT